MNTTATATANATTAAAMLIEAFGIMDNTMSRAWDMAQKVDSSEHYSNSLHAACMRLYTEAEAALASIEKAAEELGVDLVQEVLQPVMEPAYSV